MQAEQEYHTKTYNNEQVALISAAQKARGSLATEVAYAAGLWAYELFTLRRSGECELSKQSFLFTKRHEPDGVPYTVSSLDGHVREIRIPVELAQELETKRLNPPRTVTDNGSQYTQYYNISGGRSWANSFAQASKRVLGWSTGVKGLRNAFARNRINKLRQAGLPEEEVLQILQQEMGLSRKPYSLQRGFNA